MMKMEAGVPPYFEWIKDNLAKGSKIGVDEGQIPAAAFKARSAYFEKNGLEMLPTGENFVDTVWGDQKPAMPSENAFILDEKYAG